METTLPFSFICKQEMYEYSFPWNYHIHVSVHDTYMYIRTYIRAGAENRL